MKGTVSGVQSDLRVSATLGYVYMCVGGGILSLLALSKGKKKVSLSGMYFKGSHCWKSNVLGEGRKKDERLLLKVTLSPGFLCLAQTPRVPPRLSARLSSSHFCLLWLAKLSLRGKSKPFLPPAGVRLNTEMATGKRQGGKTKQNKNRKCPPA